MLKDMVMAKLNVRDCQAVEATRVQAKATERNFLPQWSRVAERLVVIRLQMAFCEITRSPGEIEGRQEIFHLLRTPSSSTRRVVFGDSLHM